MAAKTHEKLQLEATTRTITGSKAATLPRAAPRDPLSGGSQHADFYKVRLDEKVKTDVPVVFVGESPAVKEFKAIFVRNVNELEVEAFPADLPQKIEVDVSGLKAFGDQITLADT